MKCSVTSERVKCKFGSHFLISMTLHMGQSPWNFNKWVKATVTAHMELWTWSLMPNFHMRKKKQTNTTKTTTNKDRVHRQGQQPHMTQASAGNGRCWQKCWPHHSLVLAPPALYPVLPLVLGQLVLVVDPERHKHPHSAPFLFQQQINPLHDTGLDLAGQGYSRHDNKVTGSYQCRYTFLHCFCVCVLACGSCGLNVFSVCF